MSKKKETFVMPGAEPDDLDNDDSPNVDLSFMEETEEEKEAREAAEARKAERQKEIDDEAAAEKAKADAKKADEDEAAEKAKADAETKDDKDELTDEEKAEATKLEADRAEKTKKKEPMIPKSRLDEVLAKNKALQAEIEAERAAREARQPAVDKDAKAFDFDAKETEYMKLVMEGETDKALKVRKEIRAAEQAQLVAQTSTHTAQDSEAVALQKAAAEIEANFPQFRKGHEKFNEEATKVVIKMRDGLIATGSNAVEALNEAVEFAVRKFGFDESIENKDRTNVVELDEKRKADATKKKIDAQQKQPPELKGEGNKTKRQEPNAVEEMSDEEFNALPESAKRRLRGDFL